MYSRPFPAFLLERLLPNRNKRRPCIGPNIIFDVRIEGVWITNGLFNGNAEAEALTDCEAVEETVVEGDIEGADDLLALADDVTVADGDGAVHPVRAELLFVPAAQRTHPISQFVPLAAPFPLKLYVSIIQLQLEHVVLPGEDIVFVGHDWVQADVWRPEVFPNVLTGQSKQAVPPVEYVPASHCVHAELAMLPAGEEKPAAQEIHAVPPVE